MEIKMVTDQTFRKYGRILKGYDFTELFAEMEKTPVTDSVEYVPGVEALEKLSVCMDLTESMYGGLPIQIGYCNGNNYYLNAVEYHRSSEVDIPVGRDLILLLGMQQDIEDDFTYDTGKIEAFLVPAGTAVELYATTLHYAPCNASEEGFRCVVVLPKDTNLALAVSPELTGEDRLMTARNKWLIAHENAGIEGAFNGLKGENLCVR